MMIKFFTFTLLLLLVHLGYSSPRECRSGRATYRVTFTNFLTPSNFNSTLPPSGLTFSPIAAISHSNRISFLTVRGFASPEITAIAELGDNAPLIKLARTYRTQGRGVRSVLFAKDPTMPGMSTSLRLMVNCKNPFISVVAKIAPSPDWIVQISNFDLVVKNGSFISFAEGDLIAYDVGTDSGGEFTDAIDTFLDVPTEPRENIAPLIEDATDPFGDVPVGEYRLEKIEV